MFMLSELDENHAVGGIISLIKCYGHYSQHFVASYNDLNNRVTFRLPEHCRLGDIDFSSDPKFAILAILCFSCRVIQLIIGTNLVEAIIYWSTFSYIRR